MKTLVGPEQSSYEILQKKSYVRRELRQAFLETDGSSKLPLEPEIGSSQEASNP